MLDIFGDLIKYSVYFSFDLLVELNHIKGN